jgi:hypothetical protein
MGGVGKGKFMQRNSIGIPEWKRLLEVLEVDGKIILKWISGK